MSLCSKSETDRFDQELDAQVFLVKLLVRTELGRRGRGDYLPLVDDIVTVTYVHGHDRILLYEEDRHALVVDLLDCVLDVANDVRGESFARFVEHHQCRIGRKSARDGEHLLLTTAHMTGPLVDHLVEDRKVRENSIDILRILSVVYGHPDVLLDSQIWPEAPFFRDETNARTSPTVGGLVEQRFAFKPDVA